MQGAGVLYASLGDYNKAAENLEKLVKVKPPSHHLLRICAPVRTIGSWGQL